LPVQGRYFSFFHCFQIGFGAYLVSC